MKMMMTTTTMTMTMTTVATLRSIIPLNATAVSKNCCHRRNDSSECRDDGCSALCRNPSRPEAPGVLIRGFEEFGWLIGE